MAVDSMPQQIVLITGPVFPRIGKIGYGLRSLGWEVVLLYKIQSHIQNHHYCFDEMHQYETVEEALKLASRYRPLVYHVFCVWDYEVAIHMIIQGLGPVVLDNYDTLAGMLKPEFLDSRYPGQTEREKFCIESADALCCRDLSLNYLKRKLAYSPKGHIIFFPEYCWDFPGSASDNSVKRERQELHLVYAGGINVEKNCRHDPYQMSFKNGFFLDFGRDLASAGIHFHIYPQPNVCSPSEFENVFSEYLDASTVLPCFHIHRPLPVEKLIEEMSSYDLGLEANWLESETIGAEHSLPVRNYYSMSSKLTDYIEAGLGLVLGDNLWLRRRMFERYGIVRTAYLDHVKKMLLSTSPLFFRELRQKSVFARKRLAIIRHIPRLADFYLSVAISVGERKRTVKTDSQPPVTDEAFPVSENMQLKEEKQELPVSPRPVISPPPSIFSVETMLGCNLKCPECAIGGGMITRSKGYMTFEQFKVIADKIRPYCRYLYLHLWGEPMLNPDIIQIIRYASQFTACNISTNGMCLTPQLAEDLILSGVHDILFSIDGMTQETYQQYRVGGDINKALMNLKMLQFLNQKHGNRVVISPQFVVFRHNQHEMKAFRSFCALFGLEASFKAPYMRSSHSNLCNSDFLEYVRKSYPDISARAKAMSGCPDPKDVMTILLDGSVVACCYDHNNSNCFGNIFQQDVMEIWNSDRFMAFRCQVAIGNPPNFCLESCLYFPADNIAAGRSAEQENAPGCWKYSEQCSDASATSDICTEVVVCKRPADSYSCLFINTYYGGFLTALYARNQQLVGESYAQQKNILQLECFGDSDFYSYWLSNAGIPADDIIANCAPLQTAWAIEHRSSLTGEDLLVEQVRQANPAVIYVQDMNNTSRDFLEKIRPFVRLIAGQIATPIVQQIPFGCYDLLFSSFPHYVDRFRSAGLTSYYQPLAFDPRVLERVAIPEYAERPVACSFVGGISALHVESYRLLEVLAEKTVTQFWGYGADTLPAGSMIIPRHRGEAWGRDMFSIIGNSRITINRHGEVAENYANNMRLFEATGCGTLLITDYKDNLGELFKIGIEVVAYRSPEECADLVNYYLAHPEEAETIAKAGQARTLRDHTYTRRMEQTAEILARHLRYQGELNRLPAVSAAKVSYGHTPITPQEVTDLMLSAWQNSEIPAMQRSLVQKSLMEMYKGQTSIVFKVLADLLSPVVSAGDSVLELGCASGYYYEILEYLLKKRIAYTGVDYSEAMICMARDYYPKAIFFAADGANLFFADRHFNVVISSGVLLHVPNWRQHVFETVRVCKSYVIASRTPVCRKSLTRHMKKFAYGVETVELIFNEGEFVREFQLNGMELINGIQYQADPVADEYEASYLFRRV